MNLVTTCDRGYQPLLAAFLRSLELNSGERLFVTVVEYEPLDRAFLRSAGPAVEFVPKDQLGRVEVDRGWTDCRRHAANLDKLLVWLLPPAGGPWWYVDADMLCLNPLDGWRRYDHLSVVACSEQIGTPIGAVHGYARNCCVWNAGLFVFRPSRDVFDGLVDWCKRYQGKQRHGDQLPHNEYFAAVRKDEIRWMGLEWNTSIWTAWRQPYLMDLRGCRFLHFANVAKPHRDEPNKPEFRRFWELWRRYEVK